MTASEMVTKVRDHGFDDLAEARILELINDAYYNICGREPWPFLEQSASLTVNSSTGLVTAPTDIDKVLSIVDTAHGRRLEPTRLDTHSKVNSSQLTKTGDPYSYFFIGSNLYVFPIPASLTATIRYIRVPAPLTTSPDTTPLLPFKHHNAIVLGALSGCYFMEDDPENKAIADNAFETRIVQMRGDLWMRQYDRPDTIQDLDGTDEADWIY